MGKSTISMVIFSSYVKLPEDKLKPLSTRMEPTYGRHYCIFHVQNIIFQTMFQGTLCKFAGDFMFQALADSSNVSLLIHYTL